MGKEDITTLATQMIKMSCLDFKSLDGDNGSLNYSIKWY